MSKYFIVFMLVFSLVFAVLGVVAHQPLLALVEGLCAGYWLTRLLIGEPQ